MNTRSVPVVVDVGSSRFNGIMVLGGTALLLFAALSHPDSGRSLLVPGVRVGPLWYLAHVAGVTAWPVLILALRRPRSRDGAGRLEPAALVAAAIGTGAAIVSGIFGGFVRPRLAEAVIAAAPASRSVWEAVYEYNTLVNDTFADLYQVGVAAAVAIWSLALIRSAQTLEKVLGWFGLAAALGLLVLYPTGRVSVNAEDFHAFVTVNLLLAGWLAVRGVAMITAGARGGSAAQRDGDAGPFATTEGNR